MTDKPYTEADVQLVASTFIAEAKKNPVAPSTPPWFGAQTRMLLGPTEHDIARAVLDALAAAGRLTPADDEDRQAAVQDMLDDAARAFAAADTSSERVEVIRDLLAGWYAAWPSTAVTDPNEGIAWQLASMISAAEARASTPDVPADGPTIVAVELPGISR